jgi:hypothetical protein
MFFLFPRIDSTIVRILKAQKQTVFDKLLDLVTEALRAKFLCSAVLFKKRIESLIEREYIRRDVTRPNLFVYVA